MNNFHYILIQNESEICNDGNFLFFYNETKKICRKCTIEKCKNCFGSIISHIFISCIDGYYIPSDDKNRQNCKKCSEKMY